MTGPSYLGHSTGIETSQESNPVLMHPLGQEKSRVTIFRENVLRLHPFPPNFSFILFSRNPCFQLLYCLLMTYGVIVYTVRVVPYFEILNAFGITTYVLIVINFSFFGVCSVKDPGVITSANHAVYMNEYKHHTDVECYTCRLIKPARSKHCCKCDSRQAFCTIIIPMLLCLN